MKFLHIFASFLLTLTLAACNFSLAEDITPPPGAEFTPISPPVPTAAEIATSTVSPA